MSRYLLRFVLLLLTASTVSKPQAASDEALCREVYGWVSTEYYQPVDEQVSQGCSHRYAVIRQKHHRNPQVAGKQVGCLSQAHDFDLGISGWQVGN